MVDIILSKRVRQSLDLEAPHPWRDAGSASTLPPTFLFLQYSIVKEQTSQTRCRGPVRICAFGPVECRSRGSLDFVQLSKHRSELLRRQQRRRRRWCGVYSRRPFKLSTTILNFFEFFTTLCAKARRTLRQQRCGQLFIWGSAPQTASFESYTCLRRLRIPASDGGFSLRRGVRHAPPSPSASPYALFCAGDGASSPCDRGSWVGAGA